MTYPSRNKEMPDETEGSVPAGARERLAPYRQGREGAIFPSNRMVTVAFLGVLLLTACGPSIKTQKVAMPQSGKRGPLALVITSDGNIPVADVSTIKRLMSESFSRAGYGPVSMNGSHTAVRTVELVVTKFERLSPSDNTTMAAGVGCSYLCFLVAPCLLLPGYNEPQVELTAEVTARQNGRQLFTQVLNERAKASSNAFDHGGEDLNRQLEELAAHNLTVAIVKLIDKS